MKRVRREPQHQDYRALIEKDGTHFDSRVCETIYYEDCDPDGNVTEYTSEGCIWDNDGQLVPLSQVQGLVAIMDPGETKGEILQPKKHAKRKGLKRVGKGILVVIGHLK